MREGGATVVVQRTIPARSRVTIHVDQIEGLEDASASVKVVSTNHHQLVVERTMFWDQSYYGGHTANAIARPERQWTFAEGFQGFFDTYLLIANANAAPTNVTLTFLRENDTPVVKTMDVAAFQRKTVYAGEFDELKGRAFGIIVDATEPVIAERAMYFATQPGRLWAGGHVNTGIVAPSRTWFHAEGATGTFFSTFILLSNPQDTKANVEVRFLLADGTAIARQKTLEPKQRLTINPADEGDPRLKDAAVSTVVQSDVPIVSERSMYWEGDAIGQLGEGHNSSGVTETGLRWGLAEGRVGGDRAYDTYILLANPAATKADVRITLPARERRADRQGIRGAGDEPVQRGCEDRGAGVAELVVRSDHRGAERGPDRRRAFPVLECQRRVLGRRHQCARDAVAAHRMSETRRARQHSP